MPISPNRLPMQLSLAQVGSAAKVLGDMTCEETALKMVRLMPISHKPRWVGISLRNLAGDWLCRAEERFAGVNGAAAKPPCSLSRPSMPPFRWWTLSSKPTLLRRSSCQRPRTPLISSPFRKGLARSRCLSSRRLALSSKRGLRRSADPFF